MKNEEIRIGSRVKIKENTGYFDEKCHPLSLKGRVGIVVDDAGNDMMTVLFPGWGKGHDGSVCSRSKRNFGNIIDTCQYIPLNVLEVVHDGFEIGDRVKVIIRDNAFTGKIVDYNRISGDPLVDFSESKGTEGWKAASWLFHNGSPFGVIDSLTQPHSFNCYYLSCDRITPIKSDSEKEKEPTGFLFGVYSHLDGTLCIRNAEGKEVSAATLAEILASISEKD